MKLSVYIDTENKDDVTKLAAISKALSDKQTSKADLEKFILSVVENAQKVKK